MDFAGTPPPPKKKKKEEKLWLREVMIRGTTTAAEIITFTKLIITTRLEYSH